MEKSDLPVELSAVQEQPIQPLQQPHTGGKDVTSSVADRETRDSRDRFAWKDFDHLATRDVQHMEHQPQDAEFPGTTQSNLPAGSPELRATRVKAQTTPVAKRSDLEEQRQHTVIN